MPAQKRASPESNLSEEEEDDFDTQLLHFIRPNHISQHLESQHKQQSDEDEEDSDLSDDEEEEDEEIYKSEDSDDETSSSSPHAKPEFVFVQLPEIRKDVQCPICLGIIKKTRTVMECLHRFCRECIDKSMRMGNNECPACRTHCASRRSLRDDPNYDALIAVLYPDIEKYEEEELAFHEEDQTRNKQIQASIAQIYQRQSEALIKRRTPGRDTLDTYMTRTQRNNRNSYLRRRSIRTAEIQGSEENADGIINNEGRDESSNEERRTDIRPRRRRRRADTTRTSLPSSDGGGTENDLEVGRENRGISPGLAWNSEILAWGRGSARSHTRHGNAGGWSSRNTRLSKLVDYLRNLEENKDEIDMHLVLISLDKQNTPSLQQPHLCCRPSLSIKYLCEYVARQTPLKAEEVELLAVKGHGLLKDDKTVSSPSKPATIDHPGKDLQVLGAEETLAAVKASNCTSAREHLMLVYRRKGSSS